MQYSRDHARLKLLDIALAVFQIVLVKIAVDHLKHGAQGDGNAAARAEISFSRQSRQLLIKGGRGD